MPFTPPGTKSPRKVGTAGPPTHQFRCATCGHRIGNQLTPKEVTAIKVALCRGVSTQREIAEAFMVSISLISRIKRGVAWAQVPWPSK